RAPPSPITVVSFTNSGSCAGLGSGIVLGLHRRRRSHMSRSIFVIAGLVCAVGIGACDREPDIEEIANGALDKVQLNDAVDAKYDADAGVVHLSGSVG